MKLQVKDLCEQIGLEYINSIKEVSSNKIMYIIYDPIEKDELLYSYNELETRYENFLNK